jgi:hypothetical protein
VLVATDNLGEVSGYAAYDIQLSEVGLTAFVHECITMDDESRQSLMAYFFANSIAGYIAGRSLRAEVARLGLIGQQDIKVVTTPGVYIKVGDLGVVLGKLVDSPEPKPDLHGINLTVRIEPADTGNDEFAGVDLNIRDGHAKVIRNPSEVDAYVTGTAATLSQLVLGCRRATELMSAGDIAVTGDPGAIRALDTAIPPLSPFLAAPDLF